MLSTSCVSTRVADSDTQLIENLLFKARVLRKQQAIVP